MPDVQHDRLALFPGEGRLTGLMRAHDWAATALGDPAGWPDRLMVPLGMMLSSRFDMWLGWGPELNFFYNDAYAPTLGDKHPAALGRPMKAVWHEVYDTVADRIRSVLDDGVATWDEALLLLLERRGYAEETYHTFSYSPLRGDGGAVEGLMCVVSEETERVLSERRLTTLGLLADRLLGDLDRDAVAAAALAVLAASRRDFPFALLYTCDADGGWVGRAATGDAEPLLDGEWPLASAAEADGPIRLDIAGRPGVPPGDWAVPARHALLVPVARSEEEGGRAALVLGLNPHRPQDDDADAFAKLVAGQIASALANAAALTSERRRAERIWTNSRDLLLVLDTAGVIRSVNPAWARLLGHPADEVVGHAYLDFIHPDDAPRSTDELETAVTSADLHTIENRYLTRTGEIRWISWNTSFEDGLLYAYGRDVTEEKAQAEILLATEAALRQAQKMEAVGQLTGGLAHDFNNLLTGISGGLELIQIRIDQGRYDAVPRYVGAAKGAAARAAALTQRLLAFARRQTLDPRPTDVNRLIVGLEDLIRRTVGPGVTLEVVGAGGLWPALIDPPQLENALLNLCLNARDAMPGGGRITIETANKWLDDRAAAERELPPGQYLSVCVSDSGGGMTPEVIDRAFDPFFTTKPLGSGTGLGLSMIYGFTRQSGGQVRIYSEVGQGSTVCLYLPRYLGAAAPADAAEPRPAPAATGTGEVVLIVDDEATIRMLVAEVLAEAGYASIEAADGAAALRILESDARVDLLVTDVGMPGGLNGRQVADAARVLRPGLKILFITGYAENAAVGNGHLEPGMALLTKPFAMDLLAAKVRQLIEG